MTLGEAAHRHTEVIAMFGANQTNQIYRVVQTTYCIYVYMYGSIYYQ